MPTLADPLASSRAFANVEPDVRALLHERMTTHEFQSGERLMEQGAAGDALWVLVAGSAVVTLARGGGEPERVIGFVRSGEVLGEMALLTKEPRSASVWAEEAGVALVLSARDFDELVERHPEVAVVLTHLVADRLGGMATDALGGKRLDRYEIDRCIGRGAMAVVYSARDAQSGQRVALKMMSHRLVFDAAARARFEREADLLAVVEHPNIARLHRRFAALRTQFLVLELCEGPALATLLQQARRLPAAAVRAIAGQIAAALATLHTRGVIHRDLKPGNVLVQRDGQVKLADFGLAASREEIARSPDAERRAITGTPIYMAPEQFTSARADERTDLYAFGCLLYELYFGDLPFAATSLHALIEEKQLFEVTPRELCRQGLPGDLATVIAALLAVAPEERQVDLRALAADAAPLDSRWIERTLGEPARERIDAH